MAVVRMVHGVVPLPFQEAKQTQAQGWWQALGQGIQGFLTVERIRDAVVVLIAAGLYYWLARRAKDRLILTPMRVVVAQELTSIRRLGIEDADDLEDVIKVLQAPAAGVHRRRPSSPGSRPSAISPGQRGPADRPLHRAHRLPAP